MRQYAAASKHCQIPECIQDKSARPGGAPFSRASGSSVPRPPRNTRGTGSSRLRRSQTVARRGDRARPRGTGRRGRRRLFRAGFAWPFRAARGGRPARRGARAIGTGKARPICRCCSRCRAACAGSPRARSGSRRGGGVRVEMVEAQPGALRGLQVRERLVEPSSIRRRRVARGLAELQSVFELVHAEVTDLVDETPCSRPSSRRGE